MPSYELSLDAEADLLEIASYTIRTWGYDQAVRYKSSLTSCFDALARGTARTTAPIPRRPELLACRCEHHYVFSLHDPNAPVLILAVLHEQMDLMVRLRERLGENGLDG
jgi:toxin ParE1/3/4